MRCSAQNSLLLYLLCTLPVSVLGSDFLSTNGYSSCLKDSTVKVSTFDVSYNKNTRVLSFDVAGESTTVQKVTANLIVSAYGKQIYTHSFNPCEAGMTELCPGTYSLPTRSVCKSLLIDL